MKKKIIFAVLSVVLLLSLVACGTRKEDGVVSDTDKDSGILESTTPGGGTGTASPDETVKPSTDKVTTDNAGSDSDSTPIEPETTDISDTNGIAGLTEAQVSFTKTLGFTEENKKLVCMADNKDYVAFWVFNFKDSKATDATMYTLAKTTSFFDSLISSDTTIAEDGINRALLCIKKDLTNEYKDSSYNETLLKMSNATVVTETK